MKKRSLSVASGLFTIFSCLCLVLATERRALAYVNPGDGFMALQAIASVMAASGYFLRTRIKALFTRKKPESAAKPTLVLPVTLAKSDSRGNSQTAA